MSVLFLNNLDLSKFQLLNARLHMMSADPTSLEAQVYYNTASHTIRYNNGAQWADLLASSVSHHNLTDLTDFDDHSQYVHLSNARTITAQHSFAPASSQAPFILGTNAQGQKVIGLNSDLLDGNDSSAFAATVHTHVHSSITDWNTAVEAIRLDQFAPPQASLNLNSQKIISVASPVDDQDAVNKYYVDSVASGAAVPIPCDVPQGTLSRSYDWDTDVENWTVSSNGSISISNETLLLSNQSGHYESIANEPNGVGVIGDGEVEVHLYSFSDAVVLFRYNSTTDTGYGIIVSSSDSTGNPGVFLFRRLAGANTILGGSKLSYLGGSPQARLLVRFQQSIQVSGAVSIQAFVNGECMVDYLDSAENAITASGTIGLMAPISSIKFDRMRIYTSPDDTKLMGSGSAAAPVIYDAGNVTGSVSISISNRNTIRMRLTGNTTLTLTNGSAWQSVTLIVEQDATGGRTFAISNLTLPTAIGSFAVESQANKYSIVQVISSAYLNRFNLGWTQNGYAST